MAVVTKSAAPAAKPVIKSDKVKEPKVKKERVARPAFALTSAVDASGNKVALDEKGRLTAVPANWTPDSESIPGKAFASRAIKLRYKAHALGFSILRLQAKQKSLLERADKPGAKGPATPEKKVAKLKKLQAQMAELEAALKAEGISV